jgi:hypothetical protein
VLSWPAAQLSPGHLSQGVLPGGVQDNWCVTRKDVCRPRGMGASGRISGLHVAACQDCYCVKLNCGGVVMPMPAVLCSNLLALVTKVKRLLLLPTMQCVRHSPRMATCGCELTDCAAGCRAQGGGSVFVANKASVLDMQCYPATRWLCACRLAVVGLGGCLLAGCGAP